MTKDNLFGQALTLCEDGKDDDAIAILNRIEPDSSIADFFKSRLLLGYLLQQNGRVDESIEAYKSFLLVGKNDLQNDILYSKMIKLMLELVIEKMASKENVDEVIFNMLLRKVDSEYQRDILLHIFNSKNGSYISSVFQQTNKILDELRVREFGGEDYEKYIAHYTRPSIGFSLLSDNNLSRFRLSTINGVNDPQEGKILPKYMGYPTYDISQMALISCFTFNHDSLNQFRLYGKEKGIEASGISLVFKREEFFNQVVDSYANIFEKIQNREADFNQKNKCDLLVEKLPLYRCIYLEEYTDKKDFYLHIAQREEITFYRESYKCNVNKRWKKYQKEIRRKTNNVRRCLKEIKKTINYLKDSSEDMKIIDKILLPLRYLIKHAAFKEEQECRMIYISNICDNKIQMDTEKGLMYVEYDISVKNAIHKIYLSSGAHIHKDYFRKLLKDSKGEKVINSTNPFRVKL